VKFILFIYYHFYYHYVLQVRAGSGAVLGVNLAAAFNTTIDTSFTARIMISCGAAGSSFVVVGTACPTAAVRILGELCYSLALFFFFCFV
jgi:hypothetical protein